MPDFTNLISWEVLLFLLALFGIVAVQLLTGQIETKKLLAKKERKAGKAFADVARTGCLHPERVVPCHPAAESPNAA